MLWQFEAWLEERGKRLESFDYEDADQYIKGLRDVKRTTKQQLLSSMRRLIRWHTDFKAKPGIFELRRPGQSGG